MAIFHDRMGKDLTIQEAVVKIIGRILNIFLDFELMLLRFVGSIPIHTIRKLFYRLDGIKIGQGSTIHMWANFFDPSNIIIGADTIIGDHVFLDGREKLIIGNHVDIASQVLIYNSEHDINSQDFHPVTGPVEIGDFVFIGPRAIILAGVKIGKGAVVGAGAVVTKDVADFNIVGGVPAQVIGERKVKDLHYKLGRARLFQ